MKDEKQLLLSDLSFGWTCQLNILKEQNNEWRVSFYGMEFCDFIKKNFVKF